MTKYILHGGATRTISENNKKFFLETTNGLSNKATILCVYFAKKKELWPQLFEDDKINFSSAAPGKVLNFILADDKVDRLVEQIKKAEVIYLRGGKTSKLQAILSQAKNLNELWQDKVVAGSSAGAYVLAKYYYESDDDAIGQGLGLLPIKVFAHYTEAHREQLEKLKKFGEELKVYAIPEEKFFVIER